MIERKSKSKYNLYEIEIDFKDIYSSIKKRFFRLSTIVAAGFFISGLYAIIRKEKWEGQFQIVLATKTQSSINNIKNNLSQSNPLISSLIGIDNQDQLKTEVEILKSPSVLFPIYSTVRKDKILKKINLNNYSYQKWIKNHIKVKLSKGTKVLNFSYIDNDKESILKYLNMISNSYQTYSGKDREDSIDRGIKYLNNQVNFYKEKSKISFRKAQEFAIQNDLNLIPKIEKDFLNNNNSVDIESIRISSSNQIRNIKQLQKKFTIIKSNDNAVLSFSKTIPFFDKFLTLNEIKKLDNELQKLRIKFTDKDFNVRRNIELRSNLINKLKQEIIEYFDSELLRLEALQASSFRPKEVLVKYKEILKESQKDDLTLSMLESDLRFLSLEKAKTQVPWELITKPFILDKPVTLSTLKLLLIGSSAAGFIGIIYIVSSENNKS